MAELAAGILLLRMRQLGWTLTMLLAGLGLASSIYLWWAQGTTLTIPVMVQVVTVFYLNQRQVRVAFGISRHRGGRHARAGTRMTGATDLELLRRYEPIIRYTHGEYFFPMAADDYVAACDLWAVDAAGERSLLVPAGELTIDDLADLGVASARPDPCSCGSSRSR